MLCIEASTKLSMGPNLISEGPLSGHSHLFQPLPTHNYCNLSVYISLTTSRPLAIYSSEVLLKDYYVANLRRNKITKENYQRNQDKNKVVKIRESTTWNNCPS